MGQLTEETRAAYHKTLQLLHGTGLDYRPITMVLFCMVYDPGLTYWEALDIWAEVRGFWHPHRWNNEICYHFLKAGIEQHPSKYLGALIENGGLHNIENGVSFAEGG